MLLHLHGHFTFTVSFTFRVFHRYLVGMQATRATVSFNFTSLLFSLSSPSHQLHVTSPSQSPSPSKSFTGTWWACRPPGPRFPSTSLLSSPSPSGSPCSCCHPPVSLSSPQRGSYLLSLGSTYVCPAPPSLHTSPRPCNCRGGGSVFMPCHPSLQPPSPSE